MLLTKREKDVTEVARKKTLTTKVLRSCISKGFKKEIVAIIREFVVALPITLPNTIVFCFFLIAEKAMDSSGKFVPIEKRRIPRRSTGIFKVLAMLTAE